MEGMMLCLDTFAEVVGAVASEEKPKVFLIVQEDLPPLVEL
jgi:hypothetical protein